MQIDNFTGYRNAIENANRLFEFYLNDLEILLVYDLVDYEEYDRLCEIFNTAHDKLTTECKKFINSQYEKTV